MLNGFVRIFLRNIPPTSKCNYSENFNVTTLNAVRKSTKKPFQRTPLKTHTVHTELSTGQWSPQRSRGWPPELLVFFLCFITFQASLTICIVSRSQES